MESIQTRAVGQCPKFQAAKNELSTLIGIGGFDLKVRRGSVSWLPARSMRPPAQRRKVIFKLARLAGDELLFAVRKSIADSIPALQRVAWTQGECWFRPRKAAGTFVGFRVDAGDLVTLRRRAEKIIQAVSSAPSTGRDLAREAQLDRDLEAIGDNGR